MSAHWCGEPDLHRHGLRPAASKAAASAHFAIAANLVGRAGLASARVAPAAFEATVSAIPPPTRVGAARRLCPGTPRVQAACAAGYTRAALRRGRSTAGSRSSRMPSALLVAVRCCVRSGGRLGGSRTLTPSRAPAPRAGASAVPPRAVVVPPAGSAPATSGVSCRRSAWLSYAGAMARQAGFQPAPCVEALRASFA